MKRNDLIRAIEEIGCVLRNNGHNNNRINLDAYAAGYAERCGSIIYEFVKNLSGRNPRDRME
jgi:hypothetical protein